MKYSGGREAAQKRWLEKNKDSKLQKSREWHAKNKDKVRDRQLKRKFGIGLKDYNDLFMKQDGCCALCGTHALTQRFENFAVDHCHKTGKVRGLLCIGCNTALGKLGDNEEGLLKALGYVRGTVNSDL